jgi:membrane fusion protein, multidrug efflux system
MHFVKDVITARILSGLLLGCIVLSSCKSTNVAPAMHLPPPIIEFVRAEQKTVPIYQEYLGQIAAINPVEIHSQVTGLLQKIAFREGSTVKKGQLLFVIDPRPYQAARNQAMANLDQARAALIDDQKNLERDQVLFRESVLPRQQLDTQIAATQEAAANVAAAKAAVDTAALNLGYTKIYAPLEGRIGLAQIKVGALVQQDTTLLDTMYSINPIYVDFSITEGAYLTYEEAALSQHSAPRSSLDLILPDNRLYPHKGTVVMTNPTIDTSTGTLELRAEFPNPAGLLLPGMFVRVRAVVSERADAVLVPEQSIQQVQGQQSVYIVGAGNRVEFRPVKTGPTIDHKQIIDSGVSAGDQVIVEGQQKVRPGMAVVPILQATTDHTIESQAVMSGTGRQ